MILICRNIRDGNTHAKIFFRKGTQVYLVPLMSLASARGRQADVVTWTGAAHLQAQFPEAIEATLPCLY